MAKKNKGHDNLIYAKPGEVKNPYGARTHKRYKLKLLTNNEFQDIINAALQSDMSVLKKIIDDPNSSILKVGVATSLVVAVKKGDWKTIEAIIERIVGKMEIKIDHTTKGESINPNSINVLKNPDLFDDLMKLDAKISEKYK